MEAGSRYAWGQINGHVWNDGHSFDADTYAETPAALIDSDLTPPEDVATVQLGEPCRMPSQADFVELFENTNVVYTNVQGINGLMFTSPVNGKSIFLPVTGVWVEQHLTVVTTNGYYWTRTYFSQPYADNLYFTGSEQDPRHNSSRHLGMCIRPIKD